MMEASDILGGLKKKPQATNNKPDFISDKLNERKIKDLQDNLEAQKQMSRLEREKLEAILAATERERREKENLVA